MSAPFETTHDVRVADARSLDLPADSVDLVVTSPPYPMIEMWDESFAAQDPTVGEALAAGDGDAAFERMHALLDDVWARVERVLRPGGVACVNVGDATRTVGGEFRLYPNAAEVTRRFRDRGFSVLPDVLWRKPANSAAKFMGSGMLPTNAYPTLEHEHVLVFRNGDTRSFPPGDDRRYESAYFWEERNEWFSDLWEVRGERQALVGGEAGADGATADGGARGAEETAGDGGAAADAGGELDESVRGRSAAFPLEIPLRLVLMFSVYGDTVLDPFLGTGTTSLAAAAAGRSSVGVERDSDLAALAARRLAEAPAVSREVVDERLARHRAFVDERRADGDAPGYDAEHYDFPVVTKQERRIRLYEVAAVEGDGRERRARHVPR